MTFTGRLAGSVQRAAELGAANSESSPPAATTEAAPEPISRSRRESGMGHLREVYVREVCNVLPVLRTIDRGAGVAPGDRDRLYATGIGDTSDGFVVVIASQAGSALPSLGAARINRLRRVRQSSSPHTLRGRPEDSSEWCAQLFILVNILRKGVRYERRGASDESNYSDHWRTTFCQGRYSASAGPLLWNQPRVLAEPPEAL